jgi:hypothetical protein
MTAMKLPMKLSVMPRRIRCPARDRPRKQRLKTRGNWLFARQFSDSGLADAAKLLMKKRNEFGVNPA